MSDLVGNPEDQFSHVAAHMSYVFGKPGKHIFGYAETKTLISCAVIAQLISVLYLLNE